MKRQKRSKQSPKRPRRVYRRNGLVPPRTKEAFFALRESIQESWIGTTSAVSKMRADGITLPKASREFGLDPRTVIRLGGSALRKLKNGRWEAKPHDRLLRVVVVVSKRRGLLEVATRDSRQASKAGKHSAAVQRYVETGDDSALAQFKGKYLIDATGKRVALLTDLDELERLGSAGVLSFESLYARSL